MAQQGDGQLGSHRVLQTQRTVKATTISTEKSGQKGSHALVLPRLREGLCTRVSQNHGLVGAGRDHWRS